MINGVEQHGMNMDIRVLHKHFQGDLDRFRADFKKTTKVDLEVCLLLDMTLYASQCG
jgi:hypothetical protein